MFLPDAIRHARNELGLTQQKLAELAGIQRRQLGTLEKGGNVTLATLRKVLAQLPNLTTFELAGAAPTIVRMVPPAAPQTAIDEALEHLAEVVRILSEGGPGTPAMPEAGRSEAAASDRRDAAGAFASIAALAARRKRRIPVAPPG